MQTWYSSNRAQYWEVTPAPVSTAVTPAPVTKIPPTANASATATPVPGSSRATPSTAAPGAAYTRPLAPAPRSMPTFTIDLTTADQLEEVEEEEYQRLEQIASNHHAADDEVEADKTTPWLVATEWPRQFAGRPLDILAALLRVRQQRQW